MIWNTTRNIHSSCNILIWQLIIHIYNLTWKLIPHNMIWRLTAHNLQSHLLPTFIIYFCKIYLNIILPLLLCFPSGCFQRCNPTNLCAYFLSSSSQLNAQPILTSFHYAHNRWLNKLWSSSFIILQTVHLLHPSDVHILSILFSDTYNLNIFPNSRRKSFTAIQNYFYFKHLSWPLAFGMPIMVSELIKSLVYS